MNYRMSKTWSVLANVVWRDQVLCNDYRIRMDWTTATDDSFGTNIAFDRIKYWLFDVMEHSVLVKQDHERLAQLQATGQRVIAIPSDRYLNNRKTNRQPAQQRMEQKQHSDIDGQPWTVKQRKDAVASHKLAHRDEVAKCF